MLVSHINHIYGFLPQPSWTPLPCQYTKTVLKNMKGFEWDLGQGLCERVALQAQTGKAETITRKMMPHANPLPRRGTTPPYHVDVNCPFGTSTEGISVNLQSSPVPPLACWDLHGRFMISWPWLTSKTGNCSRSFPLVLDISFQDFSTLVTLDLGGVFFWEIQGKRRIWCLEINDRHREFAWFF